MSLDTDNQSFDDEPTPARCSTALATLEYRDCDFVWNWIHDLGRRTLLDARCDTMVVDVGCSDGIDSMALEWSLPFDAAAAAVAYLRSPNGGV